MANDNPMGGGSLVSLDLPPQHLPILRDRLTTWLDGVREDLEAPDEVQRPDQAWQEARAFERLLTAIGGRELEVRLSDGGNWQVKVKMGEEWRLLCRGHIDGTIFETAAADERPITVGPLRVDSAARRVEVRGASVRLTAREYELVALLATDPDACVSEG